MKTINKFSNSLSFFGHIAVALLVTAFVSSCEKDMEGELYQVSDELMLDEIMESKVELSSFLKIVDIGNMRGTLHAYGAYTLFAPDNEGIDAYLSNIGKSLESLSQSEAEAIVKYHLIPDTLRTADFIDGRLQVSNFQSKYLTTRIEANSEGGVDIRVNRQANIIEKDLRGANGYLHKIDQMLTTPSQSVADVVNSLDPLQYSLFQQFFNESDIAQQMNSISERTGVVANSIGQDRGAYFTLFIQDNDTYTSVGISSKEDLLTRLRKNTPDIIDDQILLNNYIAYHTVIDSIKYEPAEGSNSYVISNTRPHATYVADMLLSSSLYTLVRNQFINLKRDVDKVLLNEFNINGVLERGSQVDRESEFTDLSCSDGAVHRIMGNIEIVRRSAYRVYWDIAEQPEIMALKGFRKSGTSVGFKPGELSELEFGGKSPGDITYNCVGYPTTVTKDNNYVNGDNLNWRIDVGATIQWVNFKLPLLAEGKYKVWVGYRYANTDNGKIAANIRFIFKQDGQDDQLLGVTTFDYGTKPSSYSMTDVDAAFHARQEQDGQRIYCMSLKKSPDTACACFLIGIIDVTSTGRHVLRMEGVTAARFSPWWDVIHFIPLDEDQIWPKLDIRGNMIYENTPWCQIWPYTECETDPVPEEDE
jgi:uncharacterized surface protein with fasciclin (FAS1) repeats